MSKSKSVTSQFETNVDVEIACECSSCGADLWIEEYDVDRTGKVLIHVDPCAACLKAEREDAQS